jgi:hypothetical protein
MLEEGDDGDVVFRHDSVEHVFGLLEVGSSQRNLVELDEMRLDQCESAGNFLSVLLFVREEDGNEHCVLEEGSTTVNMSFLL